MSKAQANKTGAEQVTWDLDDLYASGADPQIEKDLDSADERAQKLAQAFRGRIAELGATKLCEVIREFEDIWETALKACDYAHLDWSTNTQDASRGALLQKTRERRSQLNQRVLFLELEWAQMEDQQAEKLLAQPQLQAYRHWLVVLRLFKPYLLSEAEEKILSEKAVTGREAWVRFFDELHGAARYDLDGEQVPLERVLSRLHHANRDTRRKAAESLTAGLRGAARITTSVFNNILADKASDDRLRGYSTWIASRNLSNQVDDATVETLIEAVTSRYDIVDRYYQLKRSLLDVDELYDYDRYAPLPAADHQYAWDEARKIVLEAYGSFHPEMLAIAELFFEKRWIDAPVRPGKQGGAYAAATVPSVHPYVLLNYLGTTRDVMTLAHELGHGVHQKLSGKQGLLQSDAPLTTAETASTFGEMLVFHDLMAREDNRDVRMAMLVSKIEDSFATVFRQVAMNRFEERIHGQRRSQGELTTQQLSDLWMETQRAMFSRSVTLTDNYAVWWSYIPHFLHTPGYVYAYAFGELLVLALYARYQEVGSAFAEDYLAMLAKGGSDWPKELVQPLGVDLTDPVFWSRGLEILSDMVTQAEKLA